MKRILIVLSLLAVLGFATGTVLTQQGSPLLGTGESGTTGRFGDSVALSSDGSTLASGAYTDNAGGAYAGAVFVFTCSAGVCTQQGSKLTGAGGATAEMGSSVALSQDGNTLAAGGMNDNGAIGAVWIFTRSGSTWTQQGSKLTASGEIGEGYFGSSVALSSNGSTLLAGGMVDHSGVGAAWVFTRSGSTWTQQAELTGTGESGNGDFGTGVALSADGNTGAVGAPYDRPSSSATGATWIFTRSGSTWTQQGSKLVGIGFTDAQQGNSVSLDSNDGNTLMVGGYVENAVWFFTRSGSTWTQQGSYLIGTGASGSGPSIGMSVALSGDGTIALAGAPYDNPSASYVGAVWCFHQAAGVWTQQGAKAVGTGNTGGSQQGQAVALSTDGSTAAVGGFANNSNVGATWVYLLSWVNAFKHVTVPSR